MTSANLSRTRIRLWGLYLILAIPMSAGDRFYVLLLAALGVFTFFRFPIGEPSGKPPPVDPGQSPQWLWHRLIRFPEELFWFVLLGGGGLLQAYRRITGSLAPGPAGGKDIAFGMSLLLDLTALTAFALLHYCGARWIMRKELRQLQAFDPEPKSFRSMSWSMVLIAACGLMYMQLQLFRFAASGRDGDLEAGLPALIVIGIAVFAVSLGLVVWTAAASLRDMERIADRLRELSRMERGVLLSRIPIGSPYEAGELAWTFNRLQKGAEKRYARLNKDMDVAKQVQKQLLFDGIMEFGEWRISGECLRPMEVGGGFYDALPLGNGRLLLVSGRVTGHGLPSALVMSALLMLLRSTPKETSSPSLLLSELNASLADFVPENLLVHMAVGILHMDLQTLEWSLAGEMKLSVEQENGTVTDGPAAVPLGAHRKEVYADRRCSLAGPCLIRLYTADAVPKGGPPESREDRCGITAAFGRRADEW